MPIAISSEDGVLVARFHGSVTSAQLIDSARELHEMESAQDITPPRLMDLSAVDGVHLNFTSVQEYARQRAAAKFKNLTRSAIVAPTQLQYGFARMYQTISQTPLLEIHIFRDRDSALSWLKSPAPGREVRLSSEES